MLTPSNERYNIWCHSCRKYEYGILINHPEISGESLLTCFDCQSHFVERAGQNIELFLENRGDGTILSSSPYTNIAESSPHPNVNRHPVFITPQRNSPLLYMIRHMRYPGPHSTENETESDLSRQSVSTLGIDSLRLITRYRQLLHILSHMGTATSNHLNDEALGRLNRLTVTSDTDINNLGGLCGISQEPFEGGDLVIRLQCGHCFKEEGIITWLRTRDTCPVCRVRVTDEYRDETATRDHTSPVDLSLFNHHIGISPVP